MDLPQVFGSNLALASAIVGFGLPVGIAAINQRDWASEVKAIVAFVSSLLAALVLVIAMNAATTADYFRSALIVFFVAIMTYNFYYKPSGIADRIERATG